MDKSLVLYGLLVVNLIIMIYTIFKILNQKEFKKNQKSTLLIITIIIPLVGLILVNNEKK